MIKIISGGQTGVDRIGLEEARDAGFETGGTAPKGFLTENGPDPSLKDFGLVESNSARYTPRTVQNIKDSDGTVVFGNVHSIGSKSTIEWCVYHEKPCIQNPEPQKLINWIKEENIKILNIAGNRASRLTILDARHIRLSIRTTLEILKLRQLKEV